MLLLNACTKSDAPANPTAHSADPALAKLGSVEVTARLEPIPDGAIFQKKLYDYFTVLKYTVTAVHRGDLKVGDTIYVAHYNPFKPRAEAADKFVKNVGGTLISFVAGDLHHMALDAGEYKKVMAGVVNKYFEASPDPIYYALFTTPGR